MLIVPAQHATAAENATASIDFESLLIAQHASLFRPPADDSARRNAGAGTGAGKKANATKSEKPGIARVRTESLMLSAGSAAAAALTTSEFSISTILTLARNCVRRTENTRLESGLPFGRKRWAISKFFAPIVIASRHGKIVKAETHRQPRLFSEPAPKPQQASLLEGAA